MPRDLAVLGQYPQECSAPRLTDQWKEATGADSIFAQKEGESFQSLCLCRIVSEALSVWSFRTTSPDDFVFVFVCGSRAVI